MATGASGCADVTVDLISVRYDVPGVLRRRPPRRTMSP